MSAADQDTREWALWRAVTLMGRRLQASLEQALQCHAGISVPDFEILAALAQAPGSRLRAGQLGDMLAWEKSRTSHHVARMEARDLVERVHCSDDLRGTWVAITDAGRAALAAAEAVAAETVRARLVEVIDAGDAAAVGRAALHVLSDSPIPTCQAEIDRLGKALEPADTPVP